MGLKSTGSSEKKRGPEAIGTIDWHNNPKTGKPQWFPRLSLVTGKRSPSIPLDPAIEEHDREGAKAGARVLSDRAREAGLVLGDAETVGAWFKRFHKHKEARGPSSVGDMRGPREQVDLSDPRVQGHAGRRTRGHRSDRAPPRSGNPRVAGGRRGARGGEALAVYGGERVGRPGARVRRSGGLE